MVSLNKKHALARALLCAALVASSAAALAQPSYDHPRGAPGPAMRGHAPRGMVFDNRYNHAHYYPQRGAVVRDLPQGYHPFWHEGHPFYFNAGIWYAPGPGGFIVTRPPVGLYINVLPPSYSTVWFGGVPYYYADETYYRWIPDQGYEVVDAPAGADQPGQPAQTPTDDFFIYPRNGQTTEQQSADRFECHSWSKTQTGFDPTQPNGGLAPGDAGAKRDQYRRAMTACLEARGYSVK